MKWVMNLHGRGVEADTPWMGQRPEVIGGGIPGFDKKAMGDPGCVLRTTLQFQVMVATAKGNAQRSEGKIILVMPIPQDPQLKDWTLSVQIGTLDGNPKRPFPWVVTNGLEFTLN